MGGLTISRSRHPFRTAYLCVFYSLLPLTRCTHAPVLLCHVFLLRTVRSMCITAPYRTGDLHVHIGEQGSRLGSNTVRGKGTDICSLSFGHSLSLLSYSTSKLTLLHSNAAPAPPPTERHQLATLHAKHYNVHS